MIDFLGIGAQKCGTTWLYRMLQMHPSVLFPAGKEVHYWNSDPRPNLSNYLDRFPDRSAIRSGEITPAYAMLPVEVIREIHSTNPDLRIFYCLRNPVERAWSSACMAVQRAEMLIDEASDQWFIDHFNSSGSLDRSDYETCLRNWRSVFDTESICLLRFEDIADRPRNVLWTCATHLGVDAGFYDTHPAEEIGNKVFAGVGAGIRDSLLPELRKLYVPKIMSLQDYLGWDLKAWLL